MAVTRTEKDGKVLYEVFVKGRNALGGQKALRRRGILTEREALLIDIELTKKLNDALTKVTWNKILPEFLQSVKHECCNTTLVNYTHNLGKWFNPAFKDKYIEDITQDDIRKVVFSESKPISSYTRKSLLKVIKRLFTYAVNEGIVLRNPALGIKIRLGEVVQAVLNKNEIGIFLKAARQVDHWLYYHWAMALLTGMRSGEMHALLWTDIDLESGFIKVNKSYSRFNGVGPTKTNKNRVVPISASCKKLLLEIKTRYPETEHVLPRSYEWDQGNLASYTREFCEGLGITSIKFHDLRATFITQMLNNGVPLSKVMAIVGHSSLKTTQGYLRLCGMDVAGATESLNIVLPEMDLGENVLEFKKI